MSVKLRLMRVGKKKQPTYRIVAADSRSPRDGRFIEIVGTYAPRSEPSEINVKSDKALAWLAKGAQPTETVKKLLQISGVWSDFEATRTPKVASTRVRPAKTAAKSTAKSVAKAPAKSAAKAAKAAKAPAKKKA
ncbi:MAG: 30S ribosomal protein S16 [Acidimicrobiales bacterium]